jgi:hypothetical protein
VASACVTTGTPVPLGPLPGLDRLAGHRRRRRVLGEPQTNGCAERWIRTLKEPCLWAELHDTIDQLRQAVSGFVDRYNTSWLIQRHRHQTPKEAYRAAQASAAA